MSRQVRPLPFHIVHWEAQHPVDNDDILNTGTGTVVTLMNGVTVEATVTVVTVVTIVTVVTLGKSSGDISDKGE